MLLDQKQMQYSEYRVDLVPSLRPEMVSRAKRTSVPQIFINGRHIGGFDDMNALDRAGKLDPLLQEDYKE